MGRLLDTHLRSHPLPSVFQLHGLLPQLGMVSGVIDSTKPKFFSACAAVGKLSMMALCFSAMQRLGAHSCSCK